MSAIPGTSSLVRSPEDEIIFEKSVKLKQWMTNRVKELEDQNERLRLQNLRCTTQLQMLRSFTEKSRQLKQDMAMSRSITGSLPITRDLENRTSDDSGLTSDDTSDRRQMSCSTSEATPRCTRKPMRSRKDSETASGGDKCSSNSDSSPWEDVKPIPVPRRMNNPQIDRDSLNSYADDYEFDMEDEIFDEVQSRCGDDGHGEYVNLMDYVRTSYSTIIGKKSRVQLNSSTPPTPPEHGHALVESKLSEMAEKCLGFSDFSQNANDIPPLATSPYHVSDVSNNRTHSANSNSNTTRSSYGLKTMSYCSDSPTTSPRANFGDGRLEIENSNPNYDQVRTPPRTSLISFDAIEKKGNVTLLENRMKSPSSKRYMVLKDNCLTFYKRQSELEPLMKIFVSDIKCVSKITQQGAQYAFQVSSATNRYQLMTESERTTHEWVNVIQAAIKSCTLRDIATRRAPLAVVMSGYVTRTKCGHSRRYFSALSQRKLMFFKGPDDCVPASYTNLQGALITDKQSGSSEENTGSEEEPIVGEFHLDRKSFCISIECTGDDPTYLTVRSAEEKEKWMYFLRIAANDAHLCGTPFEILLQRLLTDGAAPDCELWKDILLTGCDDSPNEPLTTVDDRHRDKTVEIAKACYLFVSVLMSSNAVSIHVDLAQNILNTVIQNDFLKNEIYAQIIKLTSGSMPYIIQGWKLLALTIPLFLPSNYALLWVLRKHVLRFALLTDDIGNIANYCDNAIDRALKGGTRNFGPSRLEAMSILARDPTSTKNPHSVSVFLPDHKVQLIEFDGSTKVGKCVSHLCLKLGMRPALLCGYALFCEDPVTKAQYLLKSKDKICDVLSEWEIKQRDTSRGRVAHEGVAKISLKLRHFWRHLIDSEPEVETVFFAWKLGEDVTQNRVPVSPQLAECLAACGAQIIYGNAPPSIDDTQFGCITSFFYPTKLLEACPNLKALRDGIHRQWEEFRGYSVVRIAKVMNNSLSVWPLYGGEFFEAGMRTFNDLPVFLCLTETAVFIVDKKRFEIVRRIYYQDLLSFGYFHMDFMLTINRKLGPSSHPDETPKERITFSMKRQEIDRISLHMGEYMRCQKLVYKVSK